MSLKGFRSITRIVHLLLALGLGAALYSPFSELPESVTIVKFALLPLLAFTGLLLWKGHKLRVWVRRSEEKPIADFVNEL
jgi:hypothetical protein